MYVRAQRAQLGAAAPAAARELAPPLRFRIVRNGHTHGELPDGDAGTFYTLGLMRELALQDAPLLDAVAGRIISTAATGDPLAAIRRFLLERVRFRHDPEGVELIAAPLVQLGAIRDRGASAGDCDDVATLGAALGLAAGYPARFVVLRFDPGAPFEHVFTELRGPLGWVELDTTRELQRVPASVRPTETVTFDVGAPDGVLQRLRLL